MTGEREVLIRYRLERARETLEEAEALAGIGRWNGCVNRLYYACFYAVTALLLKRDLNPAKHASVQALFNQHFVKSGIVAPQFGKLFNNLFQNRNRGDYRDLVRFDEPTVRPWLEEAPRFLSEMEKLAESSPSGKPAETGA